MTQIVKFVGPGDAEAIAEGISEVDFGVLEMKMTLRRRYPNSSVRYISKWSLWLSPPNLAYHLVPFVSRRLDEIGEHNATREQKDCADLPPVEEAACRATS